MKNTFDRVRQKLLEAIHEGLRIGEPNLLSLERMPDGEVAGVTGISLDLYPWHRSITLSLRESSTEYPENPPDWKHFAFVQSDRDSSTILSVAAEMIGNLFEAASRKNAKVDSQEVAHLIFLAGAEALLDPSVAEKLRSFGIHVGNVADRFGPYHRFFMVFDSDQFLIANYCELVLANRITSRLLSTTLTSQ